MKTITYKGKEYQYAIVNDSSSFWTQFYDGLTVIETKKYIFWGPKTKEQVPKHIFSLDFNIEDPSFTIDYVTKQVKKSFELLHRKEEIANGHIINND
jgi:hypothetical protein